MKQLYECATVMQNIMPLQLQTMGDNIFKDTKYSICIIDVHAMTVGLF